MIFIILYKIHCMGILIFIFFGDIIILEQTTSICQVTKLVCACRYLSRRGMTYNIVITLINIKLGSVFGTLFYLEFNVLESLLSIRSVCRQVMKFLSKERSKKMHFIEYCKLYLYY